MAHYSMKVDKNYFAIQIEKCQGKQTNINKVHSKIKKPPPVALGWQNLKNPQ
jgi:hypothetical protein